MLHFTGHVSYKNKSPYITGVQLDYITWCILTYCEVFLPLWSQGRRGLHILHPAHGLPVYTNKISTNFKKNFWKRQLLLALKKLYWSSASCIYHYKCKQENHLNYKMLCPNKHGVNLQLRIVAKVAKNIFSDIVTLSARSLTSFFILDLCLLYCSLRGTLLLFKFFL